jgi:nucleotide-binding universal stress UspA family protein
MNYRSLLVFLDQDRRLGARIAFALRVARALQCHLVGAAPTGLFALPAAIAPEAAASLAEFAELAWNALRQQAQEVVDRFDAACRKDGIHSYETVIDEADAATSLVRFAHCSDIVLLSQADPDDPMYQRTQHIVEQVVLRSARPTLLLPYTGNFDTVASRVLVAWDDSREAARAIWDALPLLCAAERVQVVSWQAGDVDPSVLASRLDALKRWLMWHGVTAESKIATREIGIAEAMLSHAADFAADLIVMGAYGHARWTEHILGGATRGMLSAMTVPVLMSH